MDRIHLHTTIGVKRTLLLTASEQLSEETLTHWGRDKIAAIFQTTFSNAYYWMKMYDSRLGFHISVFHGFELTIRQHWFKQLWLGADQAASHYLNQWWLFHLRIYASFGLSRCSHPCNAPLCVGDVGVGGRWTEGWWWGGGGGGGGLMWYHTENSTYQ